jgi:transposase
MSDFFWFSDAQWARIEPLLPTDVRGMKRVDDRLRHTVFEPTHGESCLAALRRDVRRFAGIG